MTLSIGSTDTQITDAKRSKMLDVRVTYPTPAALCPLIIFSHGAGGMSETYRYLADHWAQRGYIVIQPAHYDSIAVLRRRTPRVSFLQMMKAMPQDPEKWMDRTNDISFVIDSLELLYKLVPEIEHKVDTDAIGVGGHSYGAFTAQLVGGVRPPLPFVVSQQMSDLSDRRVKAIVAISAQGVKVSPTHFGFDDASSYSTLNIPAMYVTGDRDISVWNTVKQRTEGFKYSPLGDKFAVVIYGANHMTFAGVTEEPQGKGVIQSLYDRMEQEMPPPYGDVQEHLQAVQIATTMFWDAYLKNNNEVRDQLRKNVLADMLGTRAQSSVR